MASTRLKVLGAFAVGLLVGLGGMVVTVRYAVDRVMMMWLVNNTHEEALTLQELALGRGEATKDRLFRAMPRFAKSLEKHLGKPQVAEALWSIRLAYTLTEQPVPPEIEPLLSSLPAEAAPRCKAIQKRLAAEGTQTGI